MQQSWGKHFLKLHFQDLISNFEEFVQAIQLEKKPIPDKADLPGTDYDNKKVLGTISYIKEDPLGFRDDHWRTKITPTLALQEK